MVDAKKIESEGIKLLEELSNSLENIPETEETHYVREMYNVWRPDREPEDCTGFRDKMQRIAPRFEKGYVVAEKSD